MSGKRGFWQISRGHRRIVGLTCALIVLAGSVSTLSAAAEPMQADVERLVRQLGHSSYRDRQTAMRQLQQIGVPAKAALLRGLRDPDAEIRDRCRLILVDVLEQDYQMRVDAFESGREDPDQPGLPGWERYRAIVGETPAARSLFVDMQRSESKLLESLTADPTSASLLLAERCQDLQQAINGGVDAPGWNGSQQIRLGTLATMFFVASDPGSVLNDQISAYLHNFSYQPAMRFGLNGGEKAEPLKRVVGAWVARTAGSSNAYPGLMLSMQYDLPEGLKPAMELINQRGSQAQFLQMALLVVGRFGGRQHLALIEPLLENKDSLFVHDAGGRSMRAEVRDVALAVLVQLSGQNLKDYGMSRVEREPRMLFKISTIGFPSEAARQQALQKWNAWSASHKSD